MPTIYIIAGTNGAGKQLLRIIYYRKFDTIEFVKADEIARGLPAKDL